ncbi:MAG: pilin [Candidatus Saccharimonadales bacterium]
MKRILKTILLPVIACAMLMFSFAPSASAASSGSSCPKTTTPKGQVLQGVGQTGANCSGKGVEKTIKTIVNLLSFVVGAVAVIMIMVGGFRYITSGGGSEGVAAAKSTIIYALVGLVVVALAQVIVQIVLGYIVV